LATKFLNLKTKVIEHFEDITGFLLKKDGKHDEIEKIIDEPIL
jgi:hypothetical protein